MTVKEITVQELKKLQDENAPLLLIDVREKFEKELVDIGGTLIPLGQLNDRIGEIESEKENPVVIYCRSGARSAEACRILQSHGFSNVRNLRGGILKWADDIDPSLPKY
ncbi:MAG: rhodanese-like domain-containing protein [Cyclonatronaceae bacterium]